MSIKIGETIQHKGSAITRTAKQVYKTIDGEEHKTQTDAKVHAKAIEYTYTKPLFLGWLGGLSSKSKRKIQNVLAILIYMDATNTYHLDSFAYEESLSDLSDFNFENLLKVREKIDIWQFAEKFYGERFAENRIDGFFFEKILSASTMTAYESIEDAYMGPESNVTFVLDYNLEDFCKIDGNGVVVERNNADIFVFNDLDFLVYKRYSLKIALSLERYVEKEEENAL